MKIGMGVGVGVGIRTWQAAGGQSGGDKNA